MKNRVCERMVKFQGDHLTFRVWVTANQQFQVGISDIVDLLNSFKELPETEARSCLEKIEELDNIAAAEVLNTDGQGYLLYPDWN